MIISVLISLQYHINLCRSIAITDLEIIKTSLKSVELYAVDQDLSLKTKGMSNKDSRIH